MKGPPYAHITLQVQAQIISKLQIDIPARFFTFRRLIHSSSNVSLPPLVDTLAAVTVRIECFGGLQSAATRFARKIAPVSFASHDLLLEAGAQLYSQQRRISRIADERYRGGLGRNYGTKVSSSLSAFLLLTHSTHSRFDRSARQLRRLKEPPFCLASQTRLLPLPRDPCTMCRPSRTTLKAPRIYPVASERTHSASCSGFQSA